MLLVQWMKPKEKLNCGLGIWIFSLKMADRKALREKPFSEMAVQDRSALGYISSLIAQIYKEVDGCRDIDKLSSNLREKCGLDLLSDEKDACTLNGVIRD